MAYNLTSGYKIHTRPLRALKAQYCIATTGDLALVKFAEGDDPWDQGMNTNLDKIDARMQQNADAADDVLAEATAIGTGFTSGGGNLLLNPEFGLWQRGGSFTIESPAGLIYVADQWKARTLLAPLTATVTMGGSINGSTASVHVRSTTTPYGTKDGYIVQRLERPKAFRDKNLTFAADLQFLSSLEDFVTSSTLARARVMIVDDAGSTATDDWYPTFSAAQQTPSGYFYDRTRAVVTRQISGSATYVEVRIYFNIYNTVDPVTGTEVIDFEASNCMAGVGSSATLPFVPRSEAEDLLLCQRYYQIVYPESHLTEEFFFQVFGSNEAFNWPLIFVPMYAVPTLSVLATSGGLALSQTAGGNANSAIITWTRFPASSGAHNTTIVLESTFF